MSFSDFAGTKSSRTSTAPSLSTTPSDSHANSSGNLVAISDALLQYQVGS
jgi:hypothetical protein